MFICPITEFSMAITARVLYILLLWLTKQRMMMNHTALQENFFNFFSLFLVNVIDKGCVSMCGFWLIKLSPCTLIIVHKCSLPCLSIYSYPYFFCRKDWPIKRLMTFTLSYFRGQKYNLCTSDTRMCHKCYFMIFKIIKIIKLSFLTIIKTNTHCGHVNPKK